jgi:hypothetical protein
MRPSSLEPCPKNQLAGASALDEDASNTAVSPVAILRAVVPLKIHCAQSPGASGAGGNACAGPAAANKPVADTAIAAAISRDVLWILPFDIGWLHLVVCSHSVLSWTLAVWCLEKNRVFPYVCGSAPQENRLVLPGYH